MKKHIVETLFPDDEGHSDEWFQHWLNEVMPEKYPKYRLVSFWKEREKEPGTPPTTISVVLRRKK